MNGTAALDWTGMGTKNMKRHQAMPTEEAGEDLDTRRRIKVAARRLFAERGVEAVTVREIVAAAGAKNGGSLNYYFKSKDGLILELIAEIFRENSDEMLNGFGAMEKAGGPKDVRQVVEIIVNSYRPIADPSPTAARFLSSVLFTRRRIVREFMERMHFSIYSRMLLYIEQLRPDIPVAVLRQRWIYFAWYMVSAQSAHEAYVASGHRNPIWTDIDPVANMIDTAAGLLEAPHTANSGARQARPPRTRRKSPESTPTTDAILPA